MTGLTDEAGEVGTALTFTIAAILLLTVSFISIDPASLIGTDRLFMSSPGPLLISGVPLLIPVGALIAAVLLKKKKAAGCSGCQ